MDSGGLCRVHGGRCESESESVVEEGGDSLCSWLSAFACSSSSTSWDGPGGGVPMAIGAPSHTLGLSFTRKPQPMSSSSPRTYRTEAVVAASGPGGCRLAVAGGARGWRWRLAARLLLARG